MEVIVSLVPLVANSKTQKIVLILSSSVPVNWAMIAHGVRGHISVHVRIPSLFAFLHIGLTNGISNCYLIYMSNNNLLLLTKATACNIFLHSVMPYSFTVVQKRFKTLQWAVL